MSRHFAKLSPAAGAVLLLATCLGCGTGDYQAQLERTVGELRGEWEKVMHPSKALPGTTVTFRMPRQLFREKTPEEIPLQERKEEESIDPRRLNPPLEGVEIGGLKYTYEGFFTYGDGSKIAYYCYLAAVDVSGLASKDPNRVIRTLRQQLYAALGDASIQWSPVQCETPEGRATEWQRLQCTGKQDFYFIDKDGKTDFRKPEATLEFYSLLEGDLVVVIGWRVPKAIVEHVGLRKWAPMVAGSVTAKQEGS